MLRNILMAAFLFVLGMVAGVIITTIFFTSNKF